MKVAENDPRNQLLHELNQFCPVYAEQELARCRILDFVTATPECFDRSCRQGHITGSAWLLHPDGNRVLLTLHRKLKRWLQPGGHADGQSDVMQVALREAEEESGIIGITPLLSHIIDVDVHLIPERPATGEPAHFHYDIRYLLQAPHEHFSLSHESEDLRWWSPHEIISQSHLFDQSLLRLVHLGSLQKSMTSSH